MDADSIRRRVGRPVEDRDRVKYLLAHVWHGNQREMARAVGVSQGLISKVVNGQQAPGPRLLTALANYPGIDPDWVLSGTGQPIPFPERGSLPVAGGVLPGPPLGYPQLLTGPRHPVADPLARPTRYWLGLAAESELVQDPGLRLAAGDLLLLEADPAWLRRPDLTIGRMCGVRLPAVPEPVYHLGYLFAAEPGVAVRLFGGAYVLPARRAAPAPRRTPETRSDPKPELRRTIRPLPWEKEKKEARERAVADAKRAAADGLPIGWEDVVAVVVYMARPEMFVG